MSRYLSLIVLICGFVSLTGCGRREDRVVAEVAGRRISVREVEAAYTKIPRTDRKGTMETLWVLIDQELLILEARKQGLGETEQIREGMRKAEADKVGKVHRERLAEGVVVSKEEMRRYFDEKGLGAKTEVRASHIMVKTREEAEKVLKALEEGEDFAELAQKRSMDEPSAAKGGDLGYWERGKVSGATAQKVFSMKVGETSEPFRSKQGYHIIRIVDERPVVFERQKAGIESIIRRMKVRARESAYVETLKKESGLQVNEEALALLLHTEDAVDNVPSINAEAYPTPFLTFDGGAITLGQYLGRVVGLKPRRRPALGDSTQVMQLAERIALNTVLLPRALHEVKLRETEEVRSYLADKREELMLEELRRVEAEEKVITDAAIEDHYRAHREDYFNPVTIRVEALWTNTMEEAREAFGKIQGGANMAQLARTLSSPSDRWRNYLDFRFQCTDKDREWFGQIVQEAEKTKVGRLGAPILVSSVRRGQPVIRYAVFRVLSKTPARQRSVVELGVQTDIRRKMWFRKQAEIEQTFQTFLLELRERYADQIHVYEKSLEFVSLPEERD